MVNETILAIIIAFAISAALCPVIIPFLHRLKFGQQVRDDGPQSHLKKQGTPTMGGLIILTAIVITSLFYIKSYPRIIPILFVTVGFGIIGFLDDYIKIVMKRSEGLNPIQKLIGQFIITGIFTYYLMTSGEVGTGMLIPFTGGFENGYYLNLGWLFIPAVFFIVLGTDNGVNFTDGLDGLCTSVTILVATFFTVVAIGENSGISPITGAVVGESVRLFTVQRISGEGVHGRHGFPGPRRFRGIQRVHDADADLYRRRWPDLPGGGPLRHHSGHIL